MENNIKGRIHSVETFGAVDGPGIRYIVFFQGCPLRCIYCHNPDTWNKADGKETTSQNVVADILEYKSFIKSGGVTLSGGEPLFQPEFACAILEECRKNGLHTAVDTSGAVPFEKAKPVIDSCDMLLLDLKAATAELCKKMTGQTNENMLKILQYCESIGKRVWLRHVLVPGYTLQEDELKKAAEILSKFSCIEKVEFLPFHKLGEFKWDELKIPCPTKEIESPEDSEIERAKQIFTNFGLKF